MPLAESIPHEPDTGNAVEGIGVVSFHINSLKRSSSLLFSGTLLFNF